MYYSLELVFFFFFSRDDVYKRKLVRNHCFHSISRLRSFKLAFREAHVMT